MNQAHMDKNASITVPATTMTSNVYGKMSRADKPVMPRRGNAQNG